MQFLTSPTFAFTLGLFIALVIGNPYHKQTTKLSKTLLQICVVGLGFGINAYSAVDVGKSGIGLTIATITLTMVLAIWLGKRLQLTNHTALLIGSGTAICGGSAISAVASAVNAKPEDTSLAFATVFSLNAVGLFIFPMLGHWLGMSDIQFGLWSAIAIHDTSSVVGASQQFSDTALDIATTVKLQRALWIIPLVLIISMTNKRDGSAVKIPWFIGLFLVAMLISTVVPNVQPMTDWLAWSAKKGLTVTLFLIGVSVQLSTFKAVGTKPLALGVTLWLVISLLSFTTIKFIS